MSLASIVVVVCALLAPLGRDRGAIPVSQAQETVPAQTTAPATSEPTPSDQMPPETPAPATKTPTKKKPVAKKKTSTKRTTAKVTEPKEGAPQKHVVRNGSATDPTTQISPSLPPQQASSQLQNTTALLTTTDENLKTISGTQLNADQEDMVKQIHTYVEQARAAAGAGDLERANNLATKAQLLSAELVKK
ncbi:MAG TPA: hypothetical protein VH088_19945 [Terriglobales bacterium]|jgi:hypothetical protein|nr:hypothetical protein [Terriglobales bacterium]